MSFLQALKNSRTENLYLSKGKDKGRSAWYYVLVEKNKLPLFLKKYESPNQLINLEDYGDVILSGWGENPPADAVKQIKDRFDISDDEKEED